VGRFSFESVYATEVILLPLVESEENTVH